MPTWASPGAESLVTTGREDSPRVSEEQHEENSWKPEPERREARCPSLVHRQEFRTEYLLLAESTATPTMCI